MELTEDQKIFLNKVVMGKYVTKEDGFEVYSLSWTLNSKGEVDVDGSVFMNEMNLTQIPVKFGKVSGDFYCCDNQLTSLIGAPTSVGVSFNCSRNQLTSLEFCPSEVGWGFNCWGNNLTDYFKNIKEEDFPHWGNWGRLIWGSVLNEYPFLINIGKKYMKNLKVYLNEYPLTKLYLE